MPTLLLVAHRVLQWIEPLLYRVGRTTLVLDRIAARRLDPANLLHLQPAKWKHVQHLLAWDSHSDLLPILPLCGLERLGLRNEDPSMLTALESPSVRTLTHLDIFAGTERQPLDFEFAQLPALTHLGMHGGRRPPFFFALFASCPKLHVLVSNIWIWTSWNRRQAYQPIDVDLRFVMMFAQTSVNKLVENWTLSMGAQGGKDFGLVPSSLLINADEGKSNQPHDSGLKNQTRFDELPISRACRS
ncbi:hypothetical protein C8J57DRAFT_1517912 [Mycena rebaudengoi]|nr:hypothetical protein C8J57DRAFT_1517912 [Mycena rebaudengoi]